MRPCYATQEPGSPPRASPQVLAPREPDRPRASSKSRRTERRPKSVTFCGAEIRYIVSSPIDQYRAFCPLHEGCNKSMRINQASSEEAVVRRLKAWLVLGRDRATKHEHVFLTVVPAEPDTGTDAELTARWESAQREIHPW